MTTAWPAIPYTPWRDTQAALHLWCQILGKYRLARTPWLNHSWHATLYLTPRGLTTGLIPDGPGAISLELDLREHRLVALASDGARDGFALGPMSVAEFWRRTTQVIRTLGGTPAFSGRPSEIPDPRPFRDDTAERPYDADAVERYHGALLLSERVFQRFRSGFLGKVSPVHLFWGALDLAVTRFSGRRAPPHPGGIPNLPDAITREAYSHEVSSAGFWAGGGGVDEPMYYSYAYPEPAGFRQRALGVEGARFDAALGEFLLPYDVVRAAADPEGLLLTFLEASYQAAAELGGWERDSLECPLGQPGVPRGV